MEIIYSDLSPKFNKASIFLAGPTYRKGSEIVEGSFWRKDAISLIGVMGFQGIVFVPELSDNTHNYDYNNQVEWEYECLENCTTIVFWIPRNVNHLPAFTTNVEFGRYIGNPKSIYGRPDNSRKNLYLDWLYKKIRGRVPNTDLSSLIHDAIALSEYLWKN